MKERGAGMEECLGVWMWLFMGGGKSSLSCACCPGNKVGSSTGEECILADQWNLCVRVCVCMRA